MGRTVAGRIRRVLTGLLVGWLGMTGVAKPSGQAPLTVELQPFAAQVTRLVAALDYIGAPLSVEDRQRIDEAITLPATSAVSQIVAILDARTLLDVHINPESRVAVTAGQADARLAADGWRTFLVKVRNDAGVTAALRVTSPNADRVFSRGARGFSMDSRPVQTITSRDIADRWLDLATFDKPPLTPTLSGLALEYRIVQLYARDAGTREASIAVDVGAGSQDIGFRNDTPILFRIAPSTPITLHVRDEHDRPTTAAFIVRDRDGRLHPSPAKRLAPDFAFHPQVYRSDGEILRLAPGTYDMEVTRGPEYLAAKRTLTVGTVPLAESVRLTRWIDPAGRGWYSGDHHIHAAGCAALRDAEPRASQPRDMIRHILGEDAERRLRPHLGSRAGTTRSSSSTARCIGSRRPIT